MLTYTCTSSGSAGADFDEALHECSSWVCRPFAIYVGDLRFPGLISAPNSNKLNGKPRERLSPHGIGRQRALAGRLA
ncbi:MAG: hypothetical protein ABJC13_24445, partial [Acidobacteriota bacterium]